MATRVVYYTMKIFFRSNVLENKKQRQRDEHVNERRMARVPALYDDIVIAELTQELVPHAQHEIIGQVDDFVGRW